MLHRCILALVLATATVGPAVHAQVSFLTATDFPAGDGQQTMELNAIATADFDGLNGPDLIVTSTNLDLVADPVVILANDGAGSFAIDTTLDIRTRPSSVVVTDLNGDDILDLAITLLADDEVAVLLGDGLGGFGTAMRYGVGDAPVHITAGDIDSQNGLDLVVVNEENHSLTVLFNDGDPNAVFDTSILIDVTLTLGATPLETGPNATAVGDFDGDGDTDIAVALKLQNRVGILLNDGTSSFPTMTTVEVGEDPVDVEAALLNEDDNLDLVAANLIDGSVSVLFGDGAGGFTVDNTYDVGANPYDVDIVDMDGDGNPDLVTANRGSNDVSVLLGDATGSFGTANLFAVGSRPVGVVAADFNDDGDLDLATVNQLGDNVSVLLAGIPPIPPLPIDCGEGCGPAGLTPLLFSLLGLAGMKHSYRRRR